MPNQPIRLYHQNSIMLPDPPFPLAVLNGGLGTRFLKHQTLFAYPGRLGLVLVPDPKPTPVWIAFSILEAIYTPDEVWGRD